MRPFAFKRFSVEHGLSTMKVGTDGVLLGTWAEVPPYKEENGCFLNMLEVGCGCGLIALMLAQRVEQSGWPASSVRITAIDIHEPSCGEAAENVAKSPWKDMISVRNVDFRHHPEDFKPATFSHIVSNPPFFTESLKSPEVARNMARHNDTLPFDALLKQSERLLGEEGKLSLIVPLASFEAMLRVLPSVAPVLQLERTTRVYSKPGKACERILCTWRKSERQAEKRTENTLFIHNAQGEYSGEYRRLVKDFYLWA